jgi:hypothetical protein
MPKDESLHISPDRRQGYNLQLQSKTRRKRRSSSSLPSGNSERFPQLTLVYNTTTCLGPPEPFAQRHQHWQRASGSSRLPHSFKEKESILRPCRLISRTSDWEPVIPASETSESACYASSAHHHLPGRPHKRPRGNISNPNANGPTCDTA